MSANTITNQNERTKLSKGQKAVAALALSITGVAVGGAVFESAQSAPGNAILHEHDLHSDYTDGSIPQQLENREVVEGTVVPGSNPWQELEGATTDIRTTASEVNDQLAGQPGQFLLPVDQLDLSKVTINPATNSDGIATFTVK